MAALTWNTVASAAPTDAIVKLVVHTDDADTTFTWSAVPQAGVTLPATTGLTPGTQTSENTITVTGGNAGTITITVTGDVSTATPGLPIAFSEWSAPQLTLGADAEVAKPGDGNDKAHSPLFTFNLTKDGTATVAGAEVRWSFEPALINTVFDSTGAAVQAVMGEGTWYPVKTDANGNATIRANARQIGFVTVQAMTLGVDAFKNEGTYYSTLDKADPYYTRVPQLGPGPFTDNEVDLEGTTDFSVLVPAGIVAPTDVSFEDLTGFLHLDGNSTFIAKKWEPMQDGLGKTTKVPNAETNQNAQNTLGLFVQDAQGSVYTYYPFEFTTVGSFVNQPDPKILRHLSQIPMVSDVGTLYPPGNVINKQFIERNNGIPLTLTFDASGSLASYGDGSWYVIFEWFLNNADLTRGDQKIGPQSVATSALQVQLGSKTYTDTLAKKFASGYAGPGKFWCDFYLRHDPDTGAKAYGQWSRQGWILST